MNKVAILDRTIMKPMADWNLYLQMPGESDNTDKVRLNLAIKVRITLQETQYSRKDWLDHLPEI